MVVIRVDIYLFKVIRARCEIFSKITIQNNFIDIVLVSLSLTLNRFTPSSVVFDKFEQVNAC